MKHERVKLKDVANRIQYGYTASASDEEIGPKFLRITDIVPEQIDWQSVPYCPIDENLFEKYALRRGDIVIARTGNTTGYAKLIRDEQKAVFASYLIRVQLDDKRAHPDYVGRLIESDVYKRFVNSRKGGAAQGNANAQVLTQFEFDLPPLSTQQRIAKVLSTYDELISNNRRRMILLEESARLLYQEWFVHLRFPGHENATRRWTIKELGSIVDVKKGKNITKDTVTEGDIPVVAGGLEPAYYHNVSNVSAPVVTISASGANAGYVNLYHENIWASDCSFIDANTTPHVYYYFLLLRSKQREITGLQKGAAQPHVYPKDIMGLMVNVPDNRILNLFNDEVMPVFGLIKNLLHQNQKLKSARDILLPRLMSGEIPV